MESSDTNVSVDNISVPPQIVQEVDKNTHRYISTNSSKKDSSTPYPSLERVQNSGIHEATVLPTRDPDEKLVPPPQQARNRRESESSGSDIPEEEQDVNSIEALVTGVDNKEYCLKARGGVVDDGLNDQALFNLTFDQSDNTDDGQCTDSFVVSCQGAEHKMSFALHGWSATKTNQVVRSEMNHRMQEVEYGDGGSILSKPVCYPKLRDFIQRQATFGNWTKELPHKDNLANASLFYKGITKDAQGEDITDMVYCYKCGKSLMNFEEDDDPQNEHDRLFPECRNLNNDTMEEKEENEEERHLAIDGPQTSLIHSDAQETEEEADDQLDLPPPDLINDAQGFQRQHDLLSVQIADSLVSVVSYPSLDAPQTFNSVVAIGTSLPQLSSLQTRPEQNIRTQTSQLPRRQSNWTAGELTSISDEVSYETTRLSIQENSPYSHTDQGYEEFVPNTRFSPTRPCFRSRTYPRENCNDVTSYEGRLSTFYDWSSDAIAKETLARDGFYYEGNGDEVICFGCRGSILRWQQGDNPRREHLRIFQKHCLQI